MTNLNLAKLVVEKLLLQGVREFCLCAGARNSPLIVLFEKNPQIKTYHFFEERAASFFALGRIMDTGLPVAVITTSGTAVAECLPAMVEATYANLPLLMISADRPKNYRGSGAPQSIEQVGIFSCYAEKSYDLDCENSDFSLQGLSFLKPVHINICFQEPLLDGSVPLLELPATSAGNKGNFSTQKNHELENQQVADFLQQTRPLVLVGTLNVQDQKTVLNFLKKFSAPVYCESPSGMRGHPELASTEIHSGEQMLSLLLQKKYCTSVLRLGAVPTARVWRDLEDLWKDLPVMSFANNNFSGLSRQSSHFKSFAVLERIFAAEHSPAMADLAAETKWLGKIKNLDRKISEQLQNLFLQFPLAEPSLVAKLSAHLSGQNIYLGNSLPIREWDLAANFGKPPERVLGNRGANGIDGQISSFLGSANSNTENWCVVGDLTAMYDLSSLWIAPQMQKAKLRLVIINNKGGMIFKKIFGKDIFLNRHQTEFSHWAKMWHWDYQLWSEIPAAWHLSDHQMIEIHPDDLQTEHFWQQWGQLWKNDSFLSMDF